MNLQQYREKKQRLLCAEPRRRQLCTRCIQPDFSCYCAHLSPFDPLMKFVILIHPIEAKRRIATGRMSHLTLENSHLIMGQNYSHHDEVNAILNDPQFFSVMLYPGQNSKNLSAMTMNERTLLFPEHKKLAVFVIDGTWATAKKMVRQSENLQSLPRLCFTPPGPSNFRVRKQPHEFCYSTIEAIHHTIELLGPTQGFATQSREHDHLTHVFHTMVERQLDFIRTSQRQHRQSTYRRVRRTPMIDL